MTSTTIVIPARYAATRFPGKLVQELCGKSVLQHTWEAASKSNANRVVIATDHEKIAALAQGFGAKVLLTAKEHQSGSDRVCEAATQLDCSDNDLVINLQGDEPLFSSKDMDLLVTTMQKHPDIHMASMMHPMRDKSQLALPGCVKVVVDREDRALYFSRADIPYPRNQASYTPMIHQGIYGFRFGTLKRFVSLPQCQIEQLESLEQLRALYNGIQIHMVVSQYPAYPGIDTPQDLEYARKILKEC